MESDEREGEPVVLCIGFFFMHPMRPDYKKKEVFCVHSMEINVL